MKQLRLASFTSAYLFLNNASLKTEAFGILTPSSLLVRRSTFDASSSRSISGTKIHAEDEQIIAEASEEVTPDAHPLLPPDGDNEAEHDSISNIGGGDNAYYDQKEKTTNLKRQLYQLAASYDRGFGATPKARAEADDIIRQLATINPTEDAARGIDGDDRSGEEDVPLKAIWRMVWTSAFDVVSLGASPFAAPSAIYQDITNPPIATNIIDFIPRAQSFFPSSISPPSLLRAEVSTRASSRKGMSDRVGLLFEGLKLQPIELLGRKVDNLPPLSVDLTWPRNLIEQLAQFVPGLEGLGLTGDGEDVDADAPGYFDVEYLDDELLIIRQQAPGGVFVLVKVDSCDP